MASSDGGSGQEGSAQEAGLLVLAAGRARPPEPAHEGCGDETAAVEDAGLFEHGEAPGVVDHPVEVDGLTPALPDHARAPLHDLEAILCSAQEADGRTRAVAQLDDVAGEVLGQGSAVGGEDGVGLAGGGPV